MVYDTYATPGKKYIVCQENLGKLKENQTKNNRRPVVIVD